MPFDNYHARVKLLNIVDAGTNATADTLTVGQPYDVIADIEIGDALHALMSQEQLVVAVTNITANTVTKVTVGPQPFSPGSGVFQGKIRVSFPVLVATDGDLLRATCSYKAFAGINTDFTSAESAVAIAVT